MVLLTAAEQTNQDPRRQFMTDLAGKAKEGAGNLTGDDELKREGQVDQAVDKVKEGAEKLTDKIKDVLDK
jgi:uncharacterized protein YjbJ (UPF0337 family)